MVIVPDSDIILIKSPLKLDNYNQITFSTATAQYNYFIGLSHLEYDGCTYQRKDGVIRYETGSSLRYEDLLQYNYCMYKNDSYKDKWFYAFITDCTYVNDGLTTLKIETDVFQTWQFDLTYMNSFIEREHVSDDTIGNHTIPEGLETGEYVINASGNVNSTDFTYTKMHVCIGVSWIPDNTPSLDITNRLIGGVYSGLTYLVFNTTTDAYKFIKAYANVGHVQDIVNLYMIPEVLAAINSSTTWTTASLGGQTGISFIDLHGSTGVTNISQNISITTPSTLNGYTPKNNKLFCYPYNCLSITNNAGTQAEFRYEDFTNNSPSFDLIGVQTPSTSMWLLPKNYKKDTTSKSGYNWGIPLAKIPQGSWNADMYTNWMTQNGINILGIKIDAPTTQAIQGSLTALTGAATQNVENIGTGLGGMFGAIQSSYKASMIPNQIGGQVNAGDTTFAYEKISPTYYKISVRYEYAKMIDDFFTMYGYKVNRLATPNIHKRSNWDYIKCIDVNIEGAVPEGDLDKIRKLFNNGCTFWHTTQYFLDYSRTNSIL